MVKILHDSNKHALRTKIIVILAVRGAYYFGGSVPFFFTGPAHIQSFGLSHKLFLVG